MVFVSMGRSKLESVHWKANPAEINLWKVPREILKALCAVKDPVKINPYRKKS